MGALRAQEMAELTKFKTKLKLLEATDPNLLCLLNGPDYVNSGRIDEHGGLVRIAPAAVDHPGSRRATRCHRMQPLRLRLRLSTLGMVTVAKVIQHNCRSVF